MPSTDFARWFCTSCGAANETEIDLSAGRRQELIEECSFCDHPNRLLVEVDTKTLQITVEAQPENR